MGLYFPLHRRLDHISSLVTFSVLIFLAPSGDWDDQVKMVGGEPSAHEFTEMRMLRSGSQEGVLPQD